MKHALPPKCGLSKTIVEKLLFVDEEKKPQLTDVQEAALESGVGNGKSVLVVSPTSTGKTQIAYWGMARSLEEEKNAVYLVTHRALARQKFEEIVQVFSKPFLNGDAGGIVIASGDGVVNGLGQAPADPLHARILVATYEKYLGLLSGSGIPADMNEAVIICDEIQLLGDATRGRNVELLLTLLRKAGWAQLIALSAVLERKDAQELAEWLGAALVFSPSREKHIVYELRAKGRLYTVNTGKDQEPTESKNEAAPLDPFDAATAIANNKKSAKPVIVFCMRKEDTYKLAARFKETRKAATAQLPLEFSDLPETNATNLLADYLPLGLAIHNADLIEPERRIVEAAIQNASVDIVFATTTLSSGVHFPLGTAVIQSWRRWNPRTKKHEPIDPAEFHNMAGRVGRMGTAHESGRVVFFSESDGELGWAGRYLEISKLSRLETQVKEEDFDGLSLQLIASGLANSEGGITALLASTLSAQKLLEHDKETLKRWEKRIVEVVKELLDLELIMKSAKGALAVTPLGKAVSLSGLRPSSVAMLLEFFEKSANQVGKQLLRKNEKEWQQACFAVFHACLSSPDFRPHEGRDPTRMLPWPLQTGIGLPLADASKGLLIEPQWQIDVSPANGAQLAMDWISGESLRNLEKMLPALSAGMVEELMRSLNWILSGLANILATAADSENVKVYGPVRLREKEGVIGDLRRCAAQIRRLAWRVAVGLPDAVLWMRTIELTGEPHQLSRSDILALSKQALTTPERAMQGDEKTETARRAAFAKAKPTPAAKSAWFRDRVRSWKASQRAAAKERHAKRAGACARKDLVKTYYESKGKDFEQVFESILEYLGIEYKKLDVKGKAAAPDYLVRLVKGNPLIVELKSRDEALVDLNRAMEVLGASEIHGYKQNFCVTLCHPGVDPAVPPAIIESGRLSVVESVDLGEALLRLCEKNISPDQVHAWLTTPGQALASDLPYKQFFD